MFFRAPVNPSAGMNDWRVERRRCFGDDAEARAGFRETSFEIGFAGELVLEHIQIGHAKSVEASGLEKSGVPLERGETLRGAFAAECPRRA